MVRLAEYAISDSGTTGYLLGEGAPVINIEVNKTHQNTPTKQKKTLNANM